MAVWEIGDACSPISVPNVSQRQGKAQLMVRVLGSSLVAGGGARDARSFAARTLGGKD
jgi:hypothetical protein